MRSDESAAADADHAERDAQLPASELAAELGIFAQDKWTFKRLTLNGGLRFDYYKNKFPDQVLGAHGVHADTATSSSRDAASPT
jgi:outer membrane receptor protein involved in Fe transport